MKPYLLIIIVLIYFLFPNCKKHSFIFSNTDQQNQIIAFQPLDNYDVNELETICKEISSFYIKKVIILKPIDIPKAFFNTAVNAYSADSIINLLSKLQNDTIVEIVGLTHYSIYTIKDNNYIPYSDEAIFGMGYLPGSSCVVSDVRLKTNDKAILNHRMRNVIIHEIGHNAGLPHCPDNKCIMSKINGNIPTLDTGANNYCTECNKKLNR